ncbi:MAG: hypothetical protein ACQERC_08105 [Bacteroidota bacterium]
MWRGIHIVLTMLFLTGGILHGQETKEDIEKKAEKHFRKSEFIEATPLYLRLLSLVPRDPNYNYKYGTCLLHNSEEKKKAFKYLNFAVSQSDEVDDEAFYYLGRAYHLTFQFDKAIKNYQKYKSRSNNDVVGELSVNRQIEMCNNGKSLMANISETVVLDKQKIDRDDFFRIYDLSNIGGELIVTKDFQNRQDKRNDHVPLIHFPVHSDLIFYSSYGDKGENKDIYRRRRLPDGSWSREQRVQGNVNTRYDEDYPYMHPSGRYLYFCSKGHNSMGGYDVFRSVYDAETDAFGEPENMDISISSPDDDLLYIVDSLDKHAYFASRRESEGGKVHVYEVRVERFPIQMIIIKGQFSSTINPGEKDLTITVNDASGSEMGTFETTSKGGYLINLPKGGKYEFVMNVAGKDAVFKEEIELPYLKEFRPLKQKITETEQEGQEIVMIENLFDERFENPQAIMAEVIDKRSKMEVNKENYDIDSLDQLREQRKLLAQVGLEDYTNREIIDLIQNKADDLAEKKRKTTEAIQKAKWTLQTGGDEIEKQLKRSDSLLQLAKTTDDGQKRERYLRLSDQANRTAERKKDEMKHAEVLLTYLEKDLAETAELEKQARQLKEAIEGVETDDMATLMEKLNDHKAFVQEDLTEKTVLDAKFEYFKQIEDKIAELEEMEAYQRELLADKKKQEEKVEQLKKELEEAPRRKKDEYEMDLRAAENQLCDLENELDYTNEQLEEKEELMAQKEAAEQISDLDTTESDPDMATEDVSDQIQKMEEELNQQSSETEDLAKSNNIDLEDDQSDKPNEDQQNPEDNATDDQISEESSPEEVIAAVDPTYEEDIAALEEQERQDDATTEAIKQRKSATVESLKEKQSEIENDIQENGETSEKTAQKEAIDKAIDQLEDEIAKEEDAADDQISEESSPEEVIAAIDPSYEEDIADLEEQERQGNATTEAIKQRKSATVESLKEKQSEVENDIEENGETSEKTAQKEAIDKAIDQLEDEIAEEEEDATDDQIAEESSPEEVIAAVDPTYEEDIAALEEQKRQGDATTAEVKQRKSATVESLKEKQNEVEKDIEENGETSEKTAQKEAIDKAIDQLEDEITEEEEDATDDQISEESSPEEVIAAVDPTYEEDIAALEEQERQGDATTAEVKQRKSATVESLKEKQNEVEKDIEENGETSGKTAQKEAIDKAIDQLEDEIAEEDATDDQIAEESSPEEVIAAVDPTYEEDIAALEEQERQGDATTAEVKQRKSATVESLKEKQSEVENDIEENGETSGKTAQKEAIDKAIDQLEDEIAEEEEDAADDQISEESSPEEVISAVDPTYKEDIAALEEQERQGDATTEAIKQRKSATVKSLKEKQSEVEKDIEENGETSGKTAQKEAIDKAIDQLEDEIAEEEEDAADDQISEESSPEEVISAVDPTYEEDIADLEEQERQGNATTAEVKRRKSATVELLKEKQNEVENDIEENDIEENGTTPEKTAQKQALDKAIDQLEDEIAEEEEEEEDATDDQISEESSPEEVIAAVDPSYEKDMQELEQDYLNNDVELSALIERKNQLIENIDKELEQLDENTAASSKKRQQLEGEKRKASVSIGDWEQTEADKGETKKALAEELSEDAELSEEQRDLINRKATSEEENEKKIAALDQLIETADESLQQLSDPVERKIVEEIKQDQKEARRKAVVEFGEVDQSKDPLSAVDKSTEDRLETKERSKVNKRKEKVKTLEGEKTALKEQRKTTTNDRKQRKLDKKIEKLDEDIAEEQVDILSATTAATDKELQEELSTLDEQQDSDEAAKAEIKKNSIKSQRLLKEAEETDDPVRKAEILGKAQEEQEKAIDQSQKEQTRKEAKILIGDVVAENNLDLDPEKATQTKDQLDEKRERIGVQRLEIRDEITRIEALQKKLKSKEAEELEPVKEELQQLDESLKNEEQTIQDELEVIASENQKDKDPGVNKEAITTSIDYQEEVELAADSSYKSLAQKNNQLKQRQYELEIKKQTLENSKRELQEITEALEDPENPDPDERKAIEEQLEAIAAEEEEVTTSREKVEQTQQAIRESLPRDPEKRSKIENLLARDVAPIKEIPSLPVKTKGLVIGTNEEPAYSDKNPIPIEEEQPEGLVYRVQIGAFSNPVPNETFEEFSPISGEQINSNGLVRYMAGYFGSRGSATSARERIREMGYSDAFVVAYCDGERIPVYRAEQLRASGACVPAIETNEQPVMTAEEANENAGNGGFEKELDQFAYNKAPGAAEAEAAESKMGLYFTVQVGVYNTPVTAEELYNVSPLVTKRLENGQIRYSSGIFNSVEEAREKQGNVIEKGITDAFVVAYYKGERLMASEAVKLLEKEGKTILELENPTTTKRNKIQNNKTLPESKRLPYLRNKHLAYQLIDETYYDSFPTQVLNRYNSEIPLFYYDAAAGNIKSRLLSEKVLQKVQNNFPETSVHRSFYKGKTVKDTAATSFNEAIDTTTTYRLMIDPLQSINSDRWDILWNNPLLKSIDVNDQKVKIALYADRREALEKIAAQLRKVGVTSFTIKAVKVEAPK